MWNLFLGTTPLSWWLCRGGVPLLDDRKAKPVISVTNCDSIFSKEGFKVFFLKVQVKSLNFDFETE